MPKEMPYFLHDVMFKIVFGSKGSEIPLRAMLNALLDLRGPDRIERVRIVGLLDYNAFPGDRALHKSFSLRCDQAGDPLTEKLTFHYFQLRRLGKAPPSSIDTPAEVWLSLLKFGLLYLRGVVALPVEIMREKGDARAIDRLKKARNSEEARAWAESRDIAQRTYLTALSEAPKKGLEKGLHDEKVNTARRLSARGCDDTSIAETTGLTSSPAQGLKRHTRSFTIALTSSPPALVENVVPPSPP